MIFLKKDLTLLKKKSETTATVQIRTIFFFSPKTVTFFVREPNYIYLQEAHRLQEHHTVSGVTPHNITNVFTF